MFRANRVHISLLFFGLYFESLRCCRWRFCPGRFEISLGLASCHPEGLRLLRLGLMFLFYTERNIVFPLDLMIIVCLKARVDYIESTMGDSTAASSPPPSPGLEQETERKTRRNGDRKEPLRLVAKRCMMTTSLKRDGP